MIKVGDLLPAVTFKTRELGEWVEKSSVDLWSNERCVIFGLPGAFTPTCSNEQLPRFEELATEFAKYGINNIYCVSVNDAFVMNAWAENQGIQNVTMLPDGSGEFTEALGMLVKKDNLGFGERSWRYALIADSGHVEMFFPEEGYCDNCPTDPYEISKPDNVWRALTDDYQRHHH
tara:strand:- start:54 stop:578 length:525 start_codon:yes stop_codon:yes gene_type:complete